MLLALGREVGQRNLDLGKNLLGMVILHVPKCLVDTAAPCVTFTDTTEVQNELRASFNALIKAHSTVECFSGHKVGLTQPY